VISRCEGTVNYVSKNGWELSCGSKKGERKRYFKWDGRPRKEDPTPHLLYYGIILMLKMREDGLNNNALNLSFFSFFTNLWPFIS